MQTSKCLISANKLRGEKAVEGKEYVFCFVG